MKTIMVISAILFGALSLTGCAPLIVGGLAGAAVWNYENNRNYWGPGYYRPYRYRCGNRWCRR